MNKIFLANYGAMAGKSHGSALPCQDCASYLERNGVLAIALSDGCGSSPISQLGSRATVDVLLSLLTESFDELIAQKPIDLRKTIIETIHDEMEKTAREHEEDVERARGNVDGNPLGLLNATALFAATKEDVWIIGRIGDGEVGALIDGKMKIILEEAKSEERNGTVYPLSIASLASGNPDWYASTTFDVIKVKQEIQAVVLTSDGSDALLDRRKPFEAKYAKGMATIFETVSALTDFEGRQTFLQDEVLPLLVERSSTRDDCSIAFILEEGCKIRELEVKNYPGHQKTPSRGKGGNEEKKACRRHSHPSWKKRKELVSLIKSMKRRKPKEGNKR